MAHEIKQEVLYIKDVEQMTGRNRLTLRRWWEKGKFPKPIKLHSSVLAWHTKTVQAWISNLENKND